MDFPPAVAASAAPRVTRPPGAVAEDTRRAVSVHRPAGIHRNGQLLVFRLRAPTLAIQAPVIRPVRLPDTRPLPVNRSLPSLPMRVAEAVEALKLVAELRQEVRCRELDITRMRMTQK